MQRCTSKNVECIVEICMSAMAEEEAGVALMLKRGRGRPRKDDMRIVRPPKAVKACVDAVLQVYADDRNRAGKEWVEVAPRPVGRELSAEEQVSFLRCVASIRQMAHANSIAFRSPSSGQYESPQPVQLAAKFMGISEVTAKRIHAAFQESKLSRICVIRGTWRTAGQHGPRAQAICQETSGSVSSSS